MIRYVRRDTLIAKLPTDSGAFLPFVAGNYGDTQQRADAESFFEERSAKYAGGPRNLSQLFEGISLCAANKDIDQSSVAEFLKNC